MIILIMSMNEDVAIRSFFKFNSFIYKYKSIIKNPQYLRIFHCHVCRWSDLNRHGRKATRF